MLHPSKKLENQVGSLKKKIIPILYEFFQKIEEEGTLPNTIYFTLNPKSVSLKNVDARKKRKGIEIGKEDAKLPLFVDDMIVCVAYPKESIMKLL